MSLDLDKLRALFDLLAEKDVAEFEHEEEGRRLRIARGARAVAIPPFVASPVAHSVSPHGLVPGAPEQPEASAPSGDFVDVTSPFVGSF